MTKRKITMLQVKRSAIDMSRSRHLALVAATLMMLLVQILRADQTTGVPSPSGAAIYTERCAACHDHPTGRIPPRGYIAILKRPEAVVETLINGAMRQQAAGLDRAEINAVAEFITGKKLSATPPVQINPAANKCEKKAPPMALDGPQWNGWGRDPENTRYQPTPGLTVADLSKLKIKWVFGLPGSTAWGQAVVMGKRVYSASQGGMVFSLDADTGCTYWATDIGAGVRTTVSVGALSSTSGTAQFAVFLGELEKGIVHAVNAETGEKLWTTNIEQHPNTRLTAAPTLHGDRLYVPVSSMEEVAAGASGFYSCCTFRGSIVALDTATGNIQWKGYAITQPPAPFKINSDGTQMYGPAGAAIWGTPTVDVKRGLIYAGTGNSYTEVETEASDALVAFDIKTGERKWVSQVLASDNSLVNCTGKTTGNCPNPEGPNLDFGSSPVLRTLPNGKQVIVIGSESGIVYAFDPDNEGRILWQYDVGVPAGEGSLLGGQAADTNTFYAANFQREVVHELIEKGHVFKSLPNGALTALDLGTGKLRWRVPAPEVVCAWGNEGCSHGQRAAVTAIPGAVFSGALDGYIRAYSAQEGTILWEFDAGTALDAVNGVKAGGGAIGEGGQTIVEGTLYVHVSSIRGEPSAIIAFSVGDK